MRREVDAWKKAARRAGASFSEWARQLLNAAAVPPPPTVPPTVAGDQVELPLRNGRRS